MSLLNSGYISTDQRTTQTGTIDSCKHYLERLNDRFLFVQTTNFSPDDVTSLLFWYRTDTLTGYTNGDAITSISDYKNNYVATPFGTGPVYTTNDLNSLPVMYFTSSRGMRTSDSFSFDDWTFFILFKNESDTTSYERLLDHDYINGFWCGRNGSTASSFGGGVKESVGPYGVFTTCTDGQWNFIGNDRNDTTHNVWANGDYANRSSNSVTTDVTSSEPVGIGAWNDNSSAGQQASNIKMAEIIFYDQSLSAANRQKVEGYLAWKYDLTSLLPSDHPYKSIQP